MWQCKCWLSLQTHTCILNSLTTGNNSPLVCYIYLGWLSWISTLYQYSRNFFNSITSENIGGNLLDNELFGILGERLWQKLKLVCNTSWEHRKFTQHIRSNTAVTGVTSNKYMLSNLGTGIWMHHRVPNFIHFEFWYAKKNYTTAFHCLFLTWHFLISVVFSSFICILNFLSRPVSILILIL